MVKTILVNTLLFSFLLSSDIQEAKNAFDDKNYKEAYEKFLNVAHNGMIAKYNLGVMLEQGLGVKKDMQKALSFYIMSANDGYPLAQYALGNAYLKGVGVEKNLQVAINYYQLAAQQNHKEAKQMLKNIQADIDKLKKDWPWVTIRSNISDDKVFLNGKFIGSTKLTIQVAPNQIHKIEIQKEGFLPYKFQDLRMKPKETRTIRAYLKKDN